jgi:hypothetical protein
MCENCTYYINIDCTWFCSAFWNNLGQNDLILKIVLGNLIWIKGVFSTNWYLIAKSRQQKGVLQFLLGIGSRAPYLVPSSYYYWSNFHKIENRFVQKFKKTLLSKDYFFPNLKQTITVFHQRGDLIKLTVQKMASIKKNFLCSIVLKNYAVKFKTSMRLHELDSLK